MVIEENIMKPLKKTTELTFKLL